ncbi:hypothetical protein B0J18DRAFT_454785 [Chaetomium sp. MPI-SDFR-AT-0129]|nr:hypothetical protein B0J18DRAFT_454785 [Chaetomium sp. MPI-SDFR-AT-0129]
MDPNRPATKTEAPARDKRGRPRRADAVVLMYHGWEFRPQYPPTEQLRVRQITNRLERWARGGLQPSATPEISIGDLLYLQQVFPRLYRLGGQPQPRLRRWLDINQDRIQGWPLGDFLNTEEEDQQRGIEPRQPGCPPEVMEAWRTHPENPNRQVGAAQAPAQGTQLTQRAQAAQQPQQTRLGQWQHAPPSYPAGPLSNYSGQHTLPSYPPSPLSNYNDHHTLPSYAAGPLSKSSGQLNSAAATSGAPQHNFENLPAPTVAFPSPHRGIFGASQQQQQQHQSPQEEVPLLRQQTNDSVAPPFNPSYGEDIPIAPELLREPTNDWVRPRYPDRA